MTELEVKDIIIDTIKDATDCMVSQNTVIPLCSEWAIIGSSIASCLEGGPQEQLEKLVEKALSILESNHFLLDEALAFGQGEDVKEALRQRYDSVKLVQMLEEISGVSALKERYAMILCT